MQTEKDQYEQHILRRRIFGITIILFTFANLIYGIYTYQKASTQITPKDNPFYAFQNIVQATNMIQRNYIQGETVTRSKLTDDAITGMMSQLDKFSYYNTPEMELHRKLIHKTDICGIGAKLVRVRNQVIFFTVDENSPCANVGIRVGDILTHINGKSTIEMGNIAQCNDLLIGPTGSTISLTVAHPGEKAFHYEVMHAPSQQSSVIGPRTIQRSKQMLIRISHFDYNTADKLRHAVMDAKEKGAYSLIIDLRGCSGGDLSAAVKCADFFLQPGARIVALKERQNQAEELISIFADPHTLKEHALPLSLLVDNLTASSAEVFTAAIKDNARGLVFGENTYGKGVAQKRYELPNGGAIRMTTAYYYTPKLYNVSPGGIPPSIFIQVSHNQRALLARQYTMYPGEIQPNLENAIEDLVLKNAFEHAQRNYTEAP